MADITEHIEAARRAKEAGRQQCAAPPDIRDKTIRGGCAQGIGHEPIAQCEDVAGLAAVAHGAVRGNERSPETVLERSAHRLVPLRIVLPAYGAGHFDETRNGMGPGGRADQLLRCGRVARMPGVECEPVTVVVGPAVAPHVVGIACMDEPDVTLHRVPVLLDDSGVAIALPRGPGQRDTAIRPSGRSARFEPHELFGRRCIVGESTVGVLRVAHVLHEAAREGRHVHVVGGGIPEHIRITHPSEALVTLRTVGRNAHEIGSLAPERIFPQALDQRVADGEMARFWQVAVHHYSQHIIDAGRSGVALDLHIAKAVIGEVRLIRFACRIAAHRVDIARPRGSQV